MRYLNQSRPATAEGSRVANPQWQTKQATAHHPMTASGSLAR
ncbi:hypothetical protein [Neolewinella aurantiaca]|nr:hypothetical protein [Neolewinella aurantiaca]